MSDLFGYQTEPSMPTTGYLDPEDPKWQQSVEHIQERQKTPKGVGTFGPQSGMTRDEPTRDEWQVTSYLDSVGVTYIHKMKLGELDSTTEKPKVEYDLYLPDLVMAIETSPGWHEGGPQAGRFPQVIENDHFKKNFAEEHGIDLVSFDPAQGTEKFINETLVPKLRAVGVNAFEVPTTKNEEKERLVWCMDCGGLFDDKPSLNTHFQQTGHSSVGEGTVEKYEEFEKGNPFNQQYIYREEDTLPTSWLAPVFKYEGYGKGEEEGGGRFPDPANHIMGPGVEVKKCPHGNGVFATRDFKEGELISSFKSPFVKELPDPARGWATLRVGDLWWEEPASGEEDEWANFLDHEKSPNSVFVNFNFDEGTGDLMTTRPIKTGEEVYIDYGAYSPENIGDVSEDFAPEDLPPEVVPAVPETTTLPPTEPEKDLGQETAGYDWDYNVKYREKPILEEQSGINQNIPTGIYSRVEPLAFDQSQNVPRYPERGKVNTIEQESGGEELAADSHLFQEQEEGGVYLACPKCTGGGGFYNRRGDKWITCPMCGGTGSGEKQFDWPEDERDTKNEGRWDAPTPDKQNEAEKMAYYQLADETGDYIMKAREDGSLTTPEADALMALQTQAKEAVLVDNLEKAQEILAKMAELVTTKLGVQDLDVEGQQ